MESPCTICEPTALDRLIRSDPVAQPSPYTIEALEPTVAVERSHGARVCQPVIARSRPADAGPTGAVPRVSERIQRHRGAHTYPPRGKLPGHIPCVVIAHSGAHGDG